MIEFNKVDFFKLVIASFIGSGFNMAFQILVATENVYWFAVTFLFVILVGYGLYKYLEYKNKF